MTRTGVCAAIALTIACGPRPITREAAADLIARSLALNGVENLQLATPSGCFVLARSARVSIADVDRDPRLSRLPYLLDTLRRERELELVEFEFSETPADAPAPPVECGQLWAAQHASRADATAARSKLVAWKTLPSDKALAAGLRPGQTFPYLRQTLMDVTRMDRRDDGTIVAEYRWRWAPSYEGEHLGIRPSEPIAAKAKLRNIGGAWRIVR